MELPSVSGIISNISIFFRYYEGQFAPISEMDYNDVETSPVKVTEAAKKVYFNN